MQSHPFLASLLLFGFMQESTAMSIDNPQGAVWLGRPLDLDIPLALDKVAADDSLCLEAEVWQGDKRIPDRRLTVSLEPGMDVNTARIRLRTTHVIEEPTLSVTVKAGCAVVYQRRFTVLADPVPAAAPPVQAQAPMVAGPVVATAPRRHGNALAQASRNSGREASDVSHSMEAAQHAPVPRRGASSSSHNAKAREARLEIEVLNTKSVEPVVPVALRQSGRAPDLVYKTSAPLQPLRANDAVWRTAIPNPGDLRGEVTRNQMLESTVSTLRAQSAQTQQMLFNMRSELERARASRYSNPLVYALAAILSMALMAMGMLWRQSLMLRPRGSLGGPSGDGTRRTPWRVWFPSPRRSEDAEKQARGRDEDAILPAMGDTQFLEDDEDDEVDSISGAALDPERAARNSTEALLDAQQQSEFFMLLGQHEKAIAVLRNHIAAHPETSAAAYLDLLKLLHTLNDRTGFMQLRTEFENVFNAHLPAFDHFELGGRRLQQYPGVLARIAAQWPRPGTLALLDTLLFRTPEMPEEALELPAIRDLIRLYEVFEPTQEALALPQGRVPTVHEILGIERPNSGARMPAPALAPAPVPVSFRSPVLKNLDEDVQQPTAPIPLTAVLRTADSLAPEPSAQLRARAPLLDFALDMEQTQRLSLDEPAAASAKVDFNLFDPAIEAQIAPRFQKTGSTG